ncbi:MAG TPA: glycosyltransferase family 1 protein [Bryobacteraceae bacterium]|nr:glycosyltransferase family 1 protein [Bryobacteraceae bacterium]
MAPLRIGINALYLIPGGVGGTEIYLRHLLGALAAADRENEYFVFTNRETPREFVPAQPNFQLVAEPVRAGSRPARLAWEQTGLVLTAHARRLDVLFNAGFTAPVLCACPQVTMFHDMQHKRHPEHFRRLDLPFWRLFLWAAAHRSRILLTPSGAARADLLHYYRVPAGRVRVVPEGVDPVFYEIGRERQSTPREPFFLCPSTSHPHKGLLPLVGAFARVRRERPEFRLVITGVRGFHAEILERTIAGHKLSGAVELTGWLPRQELYKRFRHAFAFVYPSTFEGFGLPVLEALAAGVPAACSRIEPLASMAGDAALLFEPGSEDAIAAALLRLITDSALRERLAAAGPLRARPFTWEETARLTMGAFEEAAHRSLTVAAR